MRNSTLEALSFGMILFAIVGMLIPIAMIAAAIDFLVAVSWGHVMFGTWGVLIAVITCINAVRNKNQSPNDVTNPDWHRQDAERKERRG
ncbi:MAG: hypothetical protein V3V08_23510 [Nannocystaceae bacterium]